MPTNTFGLVPFPITERLSIQNTDLPLIWLQGEQQARHVHRWASRLGPAQHPSRPQGSPAGAHPKLTTHLEDNKSTVSSTDIADTSCVSSLAVA